MNNQEIKDINKAVGFASYKNNYGYGEIAILGERFENMVSKINTLINDNYVSKVRRTEGGAELHAENCLY